MARCGCSSAGCTCAVSGGSGIEVTGNGGAASPYIVSLNIGGGDDDSCGQVMNCVGSNLGAALTYDDGEHEIYVDISSDTGNMTEYGSDDGIYTPPTVITAGSATTVTGGGTPENPYVISTAPEVGDTAIIAGDGVTITGSGVTADPYVVSATGPSYGVGENTKVVDMAGISGQIPVPLGLGATTNVLDDTGDVVDNGDGTLTIRRPGAYFITANVRFQASARSYGSDYVYILNDGASIAWGGMSVPVSPEGRTAYSLSHVATATLNVTSSEKVSLTVSRSAYVVTSKVNWAELTIQRMGPPVSLPNRLGGPVPILPEENVDV